MKSQLSLLHAIARTFFSPQFVKHSTVIAQFHVANNEPNFKYKTTRCTTTTIITTEVTSWLQGRRLPAQIPVSKVWYFFGIFCSQILVRRATGTTRHVTFCRCYSLT